MRGDERNDRRPARAPSRRVRASFGPASLAAAALLVLAGPSLRAQVSKEDKVKGAFVYNFVKYVTWPKGAFEGDDAPLVIGVVDDSPVGLVVQQIVSGKTIHGRKLEVRKVRLDSPRTFEGCHVLYLGDADGAELARAISRVKGDPVLTIADDEDAFESCGVIRFVKDDTKVRFQICRDAAAKQKLEVSAKLLRLADLVECDCE